MESRTSPDSELSPVAPQAITPRSRIRRSGRVPHSAFTDPRLANFTAGVRHVLLAVHAFAERDEAQRVEHAAVVGVGWLSEHEGSAVTRLHALTGLDKFTVSASFAALYDCGLLVLSDAGVWGVPGWESESAPRVRSLRAKRAAQAAAEALDFHPFERKAAAAVADVRRPSAKARKQADPKSLGGSDSAIAERDNRRPMGRA